MSNGQHLSAEAVAHMNYVFYGMLQVINKHKKPGQAHHPIPLRYVTRPAHVPAAANDGLNVIEGGHHGS
jgi:hypothetical protein